MPTTGTARLMFDHHASGLTGTQTTTLDLATGLSDPNYDANIGSALLKRFVVTFDYGHQVMYLQRIQPTPPDVGTFDRSGLWINAKPAGYEVGQSRPFTLTLADQI